MLVGKAKALRERLAFLQALSQGIGDDHGG